MRLAAPGCHCSTPLGRTVHVPKADRVARWRAAGQDHRDLAEQIVERFPHLAFFHAQQAAEKALEGVITDLKGDAVPTHLGRVLLTTLDDLGEPPPAPVRESVLPLDAYYVATRYPDALDFADASKTFGREEASRAIALADTVLRWADSRAARE